MRNEPQLNIDQYEAIYCNEIHSDNYAPTVPAKVREALQRRELRIRSNSVVKGKAKGKKVNNKKKEPHITMSFI